MAHQEFSFKVSNDGKNISLKDYDPDYTAGLSKNDGRDLFEEIDAQLTEIQELLYAAGHNSVLIVLQGLDTSGKDGTISHVMKSLNPEGVQVTSFKAPTQEDLAHDFLWRIHKAAPAKGTIGIFNRSQYEDVLVTRVHNLVPEDVWKKRYDQINTFEQLLASNGTLIMKFFLHISKGEQKDRLQAREDEKDKRWKLSPADFAERRYWDDYITAFEDALAKCSTSYAPWYIIPANHKWFRNLSVAQTIVNNLQPYKADWRKELEERGEKLYDELQKIRLGQESLNETNVRTVS